MNADTEAILTGLRQVIERLDRSNAILLQIAQGAGLGVQVIEGQQPLLGQISEMLQYLTAAIVQSAARNNRVVPVLPTPTPLAQNESEPLLQVEITNDNLAQPIWLGGENVLMGTGRRLQPMTSVTRTLPAGSSLWAVCNVGIVNAIVAEGFNLVAGLRTLGMS